MSAALALAAATMPATAKEIAEIRILSSVRCLKCKVEES
jgi:hypothetical protein